MFPLESLAVHSVPFSSLVEWFEERLGRQVIDETGLTGLHGVKLMERVDTLEALIQVLKAEAGLIIEPDRRDVPTLVVRRRDRQTS